MEIEGLGYNNWNICDSPQACFPLGMGYFGEETDSFICSTNICLAEWLLRAEYSDKYCRRRKERLASIAPCYEFTVWPFGHISFA